MLGTDLMSPLGPFLGGGAGGLDCGSAGRRSQICVQPKKCRPTNRPQLTPSQLSHHHPLHPLNPFPLPPSTPAMAKSALSSKKSKAVAPSAAPTAPPKPAAASSESDASSEGTSDASESEAEAAAAVGVKELAGTSARRT